MEEIREVTEIQLVIYAPKTDYALTPVKDNLDTFNASNLISAAKKILDRTGLVKKERVEVTSNTVGMFILSPKQDEKNKQN